MLLEFDELRRLGGSLKGRLGNKGKPTSHLTLMDELILKVRCVAYQVWSMSVSHSHLGASEQQPL